jgi:Tfp pilus assembly protein PilO
MRLPTRHILTLAVAGLLYAPQCKAAAPTGDASLDDLAKQVESFQKTVDAFQSRLPSEKDADKILGEINQAAVASDLKTTAIQTRRAEPQKDYTQQPVQFTFTGDFHGLFSFLLKVEQLPRTLRITHLDLQKVSEGAIQAQMTINLYYRAANAGQPANNNVAAGGDEIAQLEALQAKNQNVLRDLQVVASLTERLPRSVVLQRVANCLPAGVSMVEFSLGDNHVKTTGVAQSDQQVAQYANRLSKVALLKDVNVNYSRASGDRQREFQLEMSLNPDAKSDTTASTAVEGKQ